MQEMTGCKVLQCAMVPTQSCAGWCRAFHEFNLLLRQVWILGRTYADGYNKTDLAAANALTVQYNISPLFPDGYEPPKAMAQLAGQALAASGVPYSIDNGRNVSAFWQMTGAMAALNPPVTATDATAYAGIRVMVLVGSMF